MTKEELNLLKEIESLPKNLNIKIRGLILAEVALREENKQLKENIKRAFDYVENQSVRDLSVVDVNALEGILNEGMTIDE